MTERKRYYPEFLCRKVYDNFVSFRYDISTVKTFTHPVNL